MQGIINIIEYTTSTAAAKITNVLKKIITLLMDGDSRFSFVRQELKPTAE
jgi:hypothetical protein